MADRNPDPKAILEELFSDEVGSIIPGWALAEKTVDALESAGLRIVSLEPTEEMVEAITERYWRDNPGQDIRRYDAESLRDALAAAPKRGDQTDQ